MSTQPSSCGCFEYPNQTPLAEVVYDTDVFSVYVPQNQTVPVGGTARLVAQAYDRKGNPIALAPGSFFFESLGNGTIFKVDEDGTLHGVRAGTARVKATVDQVTSNEATVAAVPD